MSTTVAAVTVARWRRELTEHQTVDGRCPHCGTRRCRIWAEAFAQLQLVDHGFYQLGPPPTDSRPHPAAG
ncbi:hypothetical protein AB0L34_27630 [Micromonospora sp. NPDC052213]|uniref:hypothetical protein n=1 Tax=Micromonospora sp. NPDC052213 TaxID=3155812 RepID=UPI00341E24D6